VRAADDWVTTKSKSTTPASKAGGRYKFNCKVKIKIKSEGDRASEMSALPPATAKVATRIATLHDGATFSFLQM
jgi:hypothetical protein